MGPFCNWHHPGQGSVFQKVPQEASQANSVVDFQLLNLITWLRLRLLKRKPEVVFVHLFLFGGDGKRRRRFQAERH